MVKINFIHFSPDLSNFLQFKPILSAGEDFLNIIRRICQPWSQAYNVLKNIKQSLVIIYWAKNVTQLFANWPSNRIPSFLPEQGFGSCILYKYLARPVKLNEAEKVRRSLCRVSCMWFGVESFQETLIIPLTDMSLYPVRSKAHYILVIYNMELVDCSFMF
jgi:hypothetical protein